MSLDTFLSAAATGSSSSVNANSFVEGQCHEVTEEGMYFVVNAWDEGKFLFGPAPWQFTQIEEPQPGDRILVLFLGAGVDRPWVISWWA